MALDTKLKEELLKMDDMYGEESWKIYSGPLLTSPQGIDSSRLSMFSQNLKQFLMILNPEPPRLATQFENTFGMFSRGYKRLNGEWHVMEKIEKYGPNSVYMLVLYNPETKTVDMIEKKFAEGMSEKQGYLYNTKVMDNLEIGDIIKDEVLYKTTSFDDNMNYRFGKNARVFSTITNDTLEDSIRIRRGWAMGVHSVEIDQPSVSINTNDVPLNVHGDADHYKVIPDIGENVNGTLLFATRRKKISHMIMDFQSQNMRTVYSTDSSYVCSKNACLYDLDIYYNGQEDFPDNAFYKQLKWYYDKGKEYAERCYEVATKIKHSGVSYTQHIPFYRDRYRNWDAKKWTSKDKKFDHIIIEFHTMAAVPLGYGSKLSGRYGNKGVISEFAEDVPKEVVEQINKSFGLDMIEKERNIRYEYVDDDTMPYTDDGPIDIILDVTASVRRLITDSTHEIEINFIAHEIWKKLKSLETFEEKRDLFFDALSTFSEFEYDVFWKLYQSFDRTLRVDGYNIRFFSAYEQKRLIDNVEEHGFYLIKAPHEALRYREIRSIYEHFPWIKPIPIYINHFGQKKIRMMNDAVVGDMYIIFLKQNTNKNFSARSTYRINRSNLPAKDNAKKSNRTSYAKTPIKLTEIYGLMAMISGRELAEYNIYMRSSTLGRKSLEQIIRHPGNPLAIKKLKLTSDFINTNAQILNAKLKILGIRLNFLTQKDLDEEDTLTYDFPVSMTIGKYKIYDTIDKKPLYTKLLLYYKRIMNSQSFIEMHEGEKEDETWNQVFELDEIKEMNLSDEFKDFMKNLTSSVSVATDSPDTEEGDPDPDELEVKIKRTRRTKAEMRKLREGK